MDNKDVIIFRDFVLVVLKTIRPSNKLLIIIIIPAIFVASLSNIVDVFIKNSSLILVGILNLHLSIIIPHGWNTSKNVRKKHC